MAGVKAKGTGSASYLVLYPKQVQVAIFYTLLMLSCRGHAEVEEGTNKASKFQVFATSLVVKVLRLIFVSLKQNHMLQIWVE